MAFDEQEGMSWPEEAQMTREDIANSLNSILQELSKPNSMEAALNGILVEVRKTAWNISVLTMIAVSWSVYLIIRVIW